ncbi:hypothetical protein D3C86_1726650 [compost metagenome]
MGISNNYALVRIHVAGVHAEAWIAEAHCRPFRIDLMNGQARNDAIWQHKHPGESTTGYHRHHFINARAIFRSVYMKTTITIQSPSPHLWGHGFHVVNFWIGRCISLAGTQVTTTVHLRSTACEVDLLQQFSTVETEYRKQLVLIFFTDGVN